MHPRRRCAGEEDCSCRSTRSCLGGAGRDSLPLLDDGAVERESGGAACQEEEPRSRRSRAACGRNLLPVKAKHVREGRRRCRVSTRRPRRARICCAFRFRKWARTSLRTTDAPATRLLSLISLETNLGEALELSAG